MGEREVGVGEHEHDLHRLLDGLLSVKPDDVVVDVYVLSEHSAGFEVAVGPA